MRKSGPPWQKLNALALSIEAAAQREPYPRLALLMQSLAAQQSAIQSANARLS